MLVIGRSYELSIQETIADADETDELAEEITETAGLGKAGGSETDSSDTKPEEDSSDVKSETEAAGTKINRVTGR